MHSTRRFGQTGHLATGAKKRLLPLAIAALVTQPAVAQNAAQGAMALEEIVVTARKRQESLQDISVAVTAITDVQLQARSIKDISEVASFAPNVTFYKSTGVTSDDRTFVFIRGVGQESPFITNDPGAGIYVDGVYLGRTQGALTRNLDVERIEVLRGPQGTLFGRNTIAGAVNIVTKKPSDEFEGYMQIEAGNHGLLNAEGKVNLPITDTLFSSAALASYHRDGYLDNQITGQELRDDETMVGIVSLRWLASDSVEVNLKGDYTKRDAAGGNVRSEYVDVSASNPTILNTTPNLMNPMAPPLVPPPNGGFNGMVMMQYPGTDLNDYIVTDKGSDDTFGTVHSKDAQDIWGLVLTVDWALSDNLGLKSITGYRDMDIELAADNDGTPALLNSTLNDEITQDQFSQEFQLTGTENRLNWVAGLYYFEEQAEQNVTTNPFPVFFFPPNLQFRRDVQQYDVTGYAAFGQATYDLSEQWSTTVGVRYNEEDKKLRFTSLLPDGSGFYGSFIPLERYPAGWLNLDETWEDVTWKLGLDYAPSDTHLYYLSISDGFKSGTFNILQPQSNPTVDQETVIAYELGMKTEWIDQRLRVNAALFYNDYEDQQVISGSLIDGSPVYDNLGDSAIYGAELETMALLSESWSIDGSVGYTETEIDSAKPGTFFEGDVGNELPFVPNWNLAAGITFNGDYSFGSLLVRADYLYRSATWADTINTPLYETEGYGLWNLRVALTTMGDSVEVYAYVKNLFDAEYNAATLAGQGLPLRSVVPGDPRQAAIGFKYKF